MRMVVQVTRGEGEDATEREIDRDYWTLDENTNQNHIDNGINRME
jgi:hypothetical protein